MLKLHLDLISTKPGSNHSLLKPREIFLESYLTEQELQLLNPTVIQRMIKDNTPLSITTYRLTPEVKQYLRRVTSVFLHVAHQEALEEYITYFMAELIDNSQKANAKRIFFQEKNLDIFSPTDYQTGMESFRKEFMENQLHYQSRQEEKGLSITMTLGLQGEWLYLEVKNNTKLTVFEYKRIHDRVMRAIEAKCPEQFLSHIDESEGAGLGFISVTCMLRKLGISEENLQIIPQDNQTIVRIHLPTNMEEFHYLSAISKEIAQTIKNIPQIPENVSRISRLLDDPTSNIGEIISLIQQDVTLSTDLLKLVNSASFRLPKASTNIEDSVKMVGLRGVRNLVYAIGSLQNLTPDTKNKKNLWQHSYMVGSYALALAHKFYGSDKKTISDAYVCGLLHDIGKILFEAAHPDTLKNVWELFHRKGIPPRIFEKIVAGANHAEIGALITKKWNFPEVIIAAIQFHHSPAAAPERYRRIVSIVHLANALLHYQNKTLAFVQMDSHTLGCFGISREEQVVQLIKEISLSQGT